jgi:hypothetical protein
VKSRVLVTAPLVAVARTTTSVATEPGRGRSMTIVRLRAVLPSRTVALDEPTTLHSMLEPSAAGGDGDVCAHVRGLGDGDRVEVALRLVAVGDIGEHGHGVVDRAGVGARHVGRGESDRGVGGADGGAGDRGAPSADGHGGAARAPRDGDSAAARG